MVSLCETGLAGFHPECTRVREKDELHRGSGKPRLICMPPVADGYVLIDLGAKPYVARYRPLKSLIGSRVYTVL